MTEHERFSWFNFKEHLQRLFEKLYKEESYADVTLVSEDQIQFKAHKIVLSACSPVLKRIIDDSPTDRPLLYQTGIKSQEIEAILHFMYIGKGKFYQERVAEFIKVAQDLEIELFRRTPIVKTEVEESRNVDKITPVKPEKLEGNEEKEAQKVFSCTKCEHRTATKSNLRRHHKTMHEGIRYPCHECGYQASQQKNLERHIQTKHEGLKYHCKQCDYKVKSKYELQQHIQSAHRGLTKDCNQCDYKASRQDALRVHKLSHHVGVKYLCNQCDFQATTRRYLNKHKLNIHEGLRRYPCNLCDYRAKENYILKRHHKSVHSQ